MNLKPSVSKTNLLQSNRPCISLLLKSVYDGLNPFEPNFTAYATTYFLEKDAALMRTVGDTEPGLSGPCMSRMYPLERRLAVSPVAGSVSQSL